MWLCLCVRVSVHEATSYTHTNLCMVVCVYWFFYRTKYVAKQQNTRHTHIFTSSSTKRWCWFKCFGHCMSYNGSVVGFSCSSLCSLGFIFASFVAIVACLHEECVWKKVDAIVLLFFFFVVELNQHIQAHTYGIQSALFALTKYRHRYAQKLYQNEYICI